MTVNKNKNKKATKLIWLSFFLIISGCGFKLRGLIHAPSWFNNVAIVVQDVHRDLVPMLKEQLQAYGINIVADPSKANYLLILEKDFSQQIITNISSSTTPRQYELIYTVNFSLNAVKGKPLFSSATVVIHRQLTVNNDRILGSDSEEMIIHREMHRDATRQIINRISKKSASIPLAEVTGVP